MSGIFGIVTHKEERLGPLLLEAGRRLSYRGYDSVGCATLHADGKIDLRKDVGKVDAVAERLNFAEMSGRRGIQIRWWQWLQTEYWNDYASVQVSDNGGATWDYYYETSGDVDLAWAQHAITLDPSYAVSNFQFRFHFHSDSSVNSYYGWYIDDVRIALFNLEGDYYAIEDTCTHDGGPLGQGRLDGCELICPRHGARFDVRTGAATRMPAIEPVPTYEVRVTDGDILVETY